MTAVRVLQGGGWIVHSLQQDGELAEPGRLAGGAPAAPLAPHSPLTREGATRDMSRLSAGE